MHRFADRLVTPLRGFVDGSSVFLHSYQSFGRGQLNRVCVDISDAEDLITARWNVTVPLASRTRSGRSQLDGPADVGGPEAGEDNQDLVLRFQADALVAGRTDNLEDYLDARDYAEHSPEIPDGLRGYRYHLEERASAGAPVRYGHLLPAGQPR